MELQIRDVSKTYPKRLTCAPRWKSDLEPGGSQMRGSACRTSAVAVTMLFAWCVSSAAQDYAGREKLRAQSNELRKEVIRVTDGVYVAVGMFFITVPR